MFRLRQQQVAALRKNSVARGLVQSLSAGNGQAQYDSSTSTITSLDAARRARRIRLGDSGFIEEIRSSSGRTTTYGNDASGRVTAFEEPSGQLMSFEYGPDDRLSAVARDGVRLCQISWNEDRSRCTVGHWDGSALRATFDPAGRPLQLKNRLGATDTLKYDARGRLSELLDARGESTRFELNAEGLPACTTHADGRSERVLAYDSMRNPTVVTSNGEPAFTASYSAPGLPTALNFSDGNGYQFLRDEKGRLLEATGPGCQTSYVYDDQGLPIQETTNGETFCSEYDATGLLLGLVYPDGARVSFGYDADKRITSITDWFGNTSQFSYAPRDRAAEVRTPNHLTQHRAQLPSGKPERIVLWHTASGGILSDSQFQYDLEQRLTAVAEFGAHPRCYVYDAESQLTGVHSRQQWLEHYQYDANGNRAASQLGPTIVEPGNRITRQGADSYVYDARGNVVESTVDGERRWFEYDLRNQLIRAHGRNGTTSFEYDALGRRLSKKTDGRDVRYVWCGEHLTREIVASEHGVEVRDYLYLPGTYQPHALRVGSRLYFFHTNHEGTPERISDATGNVVWSARYEAFGRAHIEVSAIDNPLRFAGQYFDAETGLHYNRFRYYDPRLGRYWSVDPAGLIGGHNLYTYVGNNPINRVDPLGLWWKAALSVVAGVAVAALVIATAPVSLPALAIGAMAVTAGAAVGLGLNEYLTTDHFCWPCLARGFAKGAAMTLGAALAVALVAEASVVAATVVAVGVVAYGVYSLGNMAFHWDNMTHEQRVEAIGGMLGSVAMGYVVGATGAPPTEGPPPGYAYAVTPTGETVLVPVGEATTTGAPVVAMNAGDGSGSGDDADNSPEARRARAKQKLEENQRKA